jgi:ribose 5-phosphate isomerase A
MKQTTRLHHATTRRAVQTSVAAGGYPITDNIGTGVRLGGIGRRTVSRTVACGTRSGKLVKMDPKQRAAEAAIPFLISGMRVGLGTGSTADFFLLALAAALSTGRLTNIAGVPTSRQSEHRATELGIPLTTLGACPLLDLTVDGADEVDPGLNLIKGLGGALVREKIVAQNSKQLIIIVDASKRVDRLCSRVSLPVEVVPFAHETQDRFFRSLGAVPVLRKVGGMILNTDNGNLIYDCKFDRPQDPFVLERKILDRAGVVGCGLFLNMASVVLVGDEHRVTTMRRSVPSPTP